MVLVEEQVRFAETDAMGVAHHANYFRWFEIGRVALLKKAGVYLNELMAQDVLFPITDVSCQYRASARFDDILAIETKLVKASRVKLVFSYRVIRLADQTLLAIGKTQNAFTNGAGRVARVEPELYERLSRWVEDDWKA